MENYLYFGKGDGANASGEAGMWKASNFIGVEPQTATTTRIFFKSSNNDTDAAVLGDYVEVTHADKHDTAGSYHRCKIIAQAMAEACNAGPHSKGGVISVIDVDNGIYFGGISDIIGDASFGITISLDS
tara:strand:- start:103 stop:489 length:387 start_codon:yes stop_codon:yes gene_type:complete